MNIEQDDSMILLAKQCAYLKKILDELGIKGSCKLDILKDFSEIDQIMQTLSGFRFFTAAELMQRRVQGTNTRN
jgi:hypothetical protein